MEDIATHLTYLLRDKRYESQKPYAAEFDVDEIHGAQRTNYVTSDFPIQVSAIRSDTDQFELETHGFCVLRSQTHVKLDATAALTEEMKNKYISEICSILAARFPCYKRIEPIELVIRKRDERFPADETVQVSHQQPARLVHSDYSVDGATMQLEATFKGQGSIFRTLDYDMINVWSPIVGPNNDWPLALCDFTSIDAKHDVVSADILYPDRIGENQLLYYNSRHRWHYVYSQTPEDLLVFRNIDATGERARAFHCAFHHPGSASGPRHSCEIRLVAIR